MTTFRRLAPAAVAAKSWAQRSPLIVGGWGLLGLGFVASHDSVELGRLLILVGIGRLVAGLVVWGLNKYP